MSTFDDSAKALAEVATAAEKGEKDKVVAEVINQGVGLLAGVPGVGALGKAAFEGVARSSSWGRMRSAAAELEAEASDMERARKVGAVLANMVREALYEADGIDTKAALDGLQAQVAELNAAIDRLAARSGGVVHHNHVGSVSGGSTGIVHGNVTINNGGRK